jgi:leader peptidase (prepilin peptidase)/N-methyltransferase
MPPAVFLVTIGLLGLFIGSFLNVVIHRYPLEGETVSHPRRSRCGSCGHPLAWYENVPLLSWLLQRGRCRHCGAGVSWRYPLVEALTAALWLFAARALGGVEAWPLVLSAGLVLSGLVAATFVDLDCMEIPDSVSIGGMVVGPLVSLAVPELHAESWLAHHFAEEGEALTRFGALVASLAGLATGWGILFLVGVLGSRAFGKEAMGFGDVKLLGAGGAFVGPGGVIMALMIASFLASVVGVANIARYFFLIRRRGRERGVPRPFRRALAAARVLGSYLPFGPYLAVGIGIALLCWNDVLRLALSGAR